MNAFEASNGMKVERDHNDDVLIDRGTESMSLFMADGTALALREFFRAEEDERLGRWRWPEDPSIVVYRKAVGDGIHWSVDERTGISQMNTRAGCQNLKDAHALAARAYFDAHPEPKPWEADPRLGDVWAFTLRSGGKPVLGVMRAKNGGEWRWAATDLPVDFDQVAEGRRIWPEVAS